LLIWMKSAIYVSPHEASPIAFLHTAPALREI
jgi:hypothetical protein